MQKTGDEKLKKEESAYKALMVHDTIWTPERSLWCSVVGQAVIDAASTDHQIRTEVREWLESEDFPVVCGMAGMRPEHIKGILVPILADKDTKRAFRKAMTFKIILRNWIDSHYGEIDRKKPA